MMSAYHQYYFQLTEEKLGTSERTELDAHFENLAERSDSTKLWTEKILSDTEAVLTPNPGLTSVLPEKFPTTLFYFISANPLSQVNVLKIFSLTRLTRKDPLD